MTVPAETPPPAMTSPSLAYGADEIKAAAENVLAAYCGSCHGPAAPIAASGGFRFIDDIDQLVAAGLIVPLNSAASPIIARMRDGTMPPSGTGSPYVPYGAINIVAEYIDNPRLWPGVGTPTPSDGGTETPALDAGAAGVDGG
jgi:hypothetical protein